MLVTINNVNANKKNPKMLYIRLSKKLQNVPSASWILVTKGTMPNMVLKRSFNCWIYAVLTKEISKRISALTNDQSNISSHDIYLKRTPITSKRAESLICRHMELSEHIMWNITHHYLIRLIFQSCHLLFNNATLLISRQPAGL